MVFPLKVVANVTKAIAGPTHKKYFGTSGRSRYRKSMKTKILIAFLLLTSSVNWAKDQGCNVGSDFYGELSPTLPPEPSLYKKLIQNKLKKNQVHETALLKNGWQVSIEQTGCSHHITQYVFSIPESLAKGSLREQALMVLKALPFVNEDRTTLIIQELKLSKTKEIKSGMPFKCGDGSCVIQWNKSELKIVYDFPT